MKRVDVLYGGVRYTIADREVADLQAEIEKAILDGRPWWLTVNHGEGTLHEAHLLITPGADLALLPQDPAIQDDRTEGNGALPGELVS